MTLTEFLTARLAEDEAAARAATCETGRWHWDHAFGDLCNDAECPYGELVDQPASSSDHSGTVLMRVHGLDVVHEPWRGAEHIARHDPDRVMRDVEAKRRIVGEHEHDLSGRYGDEPGCWTCHGDRDYQLIALGWCPTLRLLALPYSDHEDYDETWRP